MATSKEEMNETLSYRRYDEGDTEWGSFVDKIFVEDTSYKCPTYVHRTPPCQGSCPAGEDIRGWLQIVREIEKPAEDDSWQKYAFERATDANPFPAMMGRVCPAPCEEGCNRNDIEDFVGINAVEQYIGDKAREDGYTFTENLPELSGKKVAIIGAGPAGLSAAYQLRRKGHASMIFDDHDDLGGMFRYGIPGYRVPRDALDHEIKRITEMDGVEVTLSTRVGKDISVESLEKDYDALLWAIGCKAGRPLPVPGADAPNCVTGVEFLEIFNQGKMHYTPEKILCVGGGDTSIDVVSVARRLGVLKNPDSSELPEAVVRGDIIHKEVDASAKQGGTVTLTSLFPKHNMTAAEHEISDATKEGVDILDALMPIEVVLNSEGRATGLRVAKCKLDDSGDSPIFPLEAIEGTEEVIECDLIVSAIGQFGDMDGIEGFDNGKGLIDADQFYQVANKPGHFVAGDIVRPHLLTTAIGHASVVAETIHNTFNDSRLKRRPKVDKNTFDLLEKLHEAGLDPVKYDNSGDLRGTDSSDFAVHNFEDRSKNEIIKTDEMFLGHFEYEARNKREEIVPDSEEVLGHFEERIQALSEEQTQAEAGRCMSCGMCFECDNCVIYCPQDAVFRVKKGQNTTGRYVDTDYDRCIGCHICSDVCPTGYIDMALG